MDEQDRFRPQAEHFTFEPLSPEAETVRKQPACRDHGSGFVVLLFALILCLAVVTCLLTFGVGFQLNRTDNGVSFSVTLRSDEQSEVMEERHAALPEQPVLPQASPAESTQIRVSAPTVNTALRSGSEDLPIARKNEQELTLQEIYAKLSPCCVSVTASYAAGTSTGSGFILTPDGYVATNAHVISGAQTVDVALESGKHYPAQVVGCDTVSDLAVLKIEAGELPCVELGDSDSLQVGDPVVAIGDPLGIELRGTMTNGIVSAINRDVEVSGRTMTLIQTNAALNEGNSGGPLLNMQGQVVGINTMKISSLRSSVEGLGFAIPSQIAAPILSELMEQGFIAGRPALGLDGISVPAYASAFYRLPQGVYVRSVEESSDAAAKGIQPGDVITGWNNSVIGELDDLTTLMNLSEAGDTVRLTIYRRGIYYSVDVTLEQAH